jgi:hypothetical protein
MVFKRLENESDEELIYRICSQKDQIGTWEQVKDVLNELTGNDYGESTYRKRYQAFDKMIKANQGKFYDGSAMIEELKEQRRALEREKVKFRDERRAWNKQNYIDSRVEEKLDILEEELLSIGRTLYEPHDVTEINSDNDMLVILSDFHIGATYSSLTGEYNVNIARERLQKLLEEIIKIQKRHNSEKCYISLQGDLISGNIHKSIQVTNAEDVIEQIKIATELVIGFAYEVSKYFTNVYISSVSGNHSRIDKKEEAIHSERLDNIIIWATGLALNGVDNIHFLKRNLDNGIYDLNIRGKSYIAVHGDYDSFNKTGVANLSMMLGYVPYAITFGHLHTCAVDEAHGVKMIRGGSLGGSGDDYTLEKRLVGKASQMVCICDKNGVVCYYPIELS